MAHNIKFGLSDHDLGREEKAVTFSVTNNEGKVGRLLVSKGGLRWYPKGSSKSNYFIRWSKIGELFENSGRKQT